MTIYIPYPIISDEWRGVFLGLCEKLGLSSNEGLAPCTYLYYAMIHIPMQYTTYGVVRYMHHAPTTLHLEQRRQMNNVRPLLIAVRAVLGQVVA